MCFHDLKISSLHYKWVLLHVCHVWLVAQNRQTKHCFLEQPFVFLCSLYVLQHVWKRVRGQGYSVAICNLTTRYH